MRLCKDWTQFKLRYANAMLRLVEKAPPEAPPPEHILAGLTRAIDEINKTNGRWEELEGRLRNLEGQIRTLNSDNSMRKMGRA